MPQVLTVKQDLDLVRAVVDAVEQNLLTPEGGFKGQPDFKDDAAVVAAVEAAVLAQGVKIDPKVQRVISSVVAVLGLVG